MHYTDIRRFFKNYRFIKKELEARTEYINDFKKILINPLPKSEEALNKIYTNIVKDMQKEARRLRYILNTLDFAMKKLSGAERNVLYHRYVIGTEWINLPEHIMYEQRTCQHLEVSALKKLAKMDLDWEGKNAE